MIGRLKNEKGEFYDQEEYEGRTIFVRYVWFDITPDSARFEQSFSIDGGKKWESNWITMQMRQSAMPPTPLQPKGQPGGQRGFDFEFGTWHAQLKRLQHPLTGSHTWVNYDGSAIVGKLWNGRANFGEFEVASSTMHPEGLSLRLYNSRPPQWNISWANSRDGILTTPMIGEFKEGDLRSIYLLRYHSRLLSAGAGVLRRWRKDLGAELDRELHETGAITPQRTFR